MSDSSTAKQEEDKSKPNQDVKVKARKQEYQASKMLLP